MDVDTWERDAKNRPSWRKRSLMLVTPLKKREKRSTLGRMEEKTPQKSNLKQAFIEIDGQPMMMTPYIFITHPVYQNLILHDIGPQYD